MSHDAVLKEIAGSIPGRAAARLRAVWLVFMLVGAVSFALLLATEPLRAWGA